MIPQLKITEKLQKCTGQKVWKSALTKVQYKQNWSLMSTRAFMSAIFQCLIFEMAALFGLKGLFMFRSDLSWGNWTAYWGALHKSSSGR